MYVLDKLWRGKLSPCEPCSVYGSEYSNLTTKRTRIEAQLAAKLSEEGRTVFKEYQQVQKQLSAISEEDMFVNGFRIGVGLILDATGNYESQFVRYHEDE